MKKLFTLSLAITIALSGMAQKNHKGNGKQKHKTQVKHRGNNTHEDRNQDDNRDKVSKNLPSKVRSSFNRDFPNANNVSWTKNNGYWTASFPDGIYRTSVTYSANGARINSASARNQRRTNSSANDGSIWDKILSRQ
jgi:hypothetical protein